MAEVDPLALVAFAAACLGGLLAALSVGALRWLGGVKRWWLHWCGGEALARLRDAPEGPVVIEGVLRAVEGAGPVVVATVMPPGSEVALEWAEAASAAAPELRVEMPDGVVMIPGEALVASAACEVAPGQPLPAVARALGDLPAELCAVARREVRCLFAGDRVLATGRIERAPDLDGPAGYRTRAVRHRLFAAEGMPGVLLRSVGPPRPFVQAWRRWVAGILGGAASAAIASFALVEARPEIAAPSFVESHQQDAIDAKLGQGLYLEAGLLAERTSDLERAARAYFEAGELPRAARMFGRARLLLPQLVPTYAELDAEIAAHRWGLAAQVADLLAARELDSSVAAEIHCFAEALRIKEDPARPPPGATRGGEVSPGRPSAGKNGLCALALSDVSRVPVDSRGYEDGLFVLSAGTLPPTPYDADARVGALLVREHGLRKTWALVPPHAAHALRAQVPMYRMPVFALESSVRERTGEDAPKERVDHAAMLAVWHSYLGDHVAAAGALREALILAGLEALAPPAAAKPGILFDGGLPLSIGHDPVKPRDRAMVRLLPLAAALALRAGELRAASAYAGLVSDEDDPTSVRLYVWAATGQGAQPMFHVETLETASGRNFLLAARQANPWDYDAALEHVDGQGLWPVVRLGTPADRLTALSVMTNVTPRPSEDGGVHALLSRLADKRAASQAGATSPEKPLAERIAGLEAPLLDREATVLLYVSGRLAGP